MDDIHNVFMYFAGLADKDGGEMIDSPIPDTESKIVKEPVGVVTQITPWNYPLLQACTGNCASACYGLFTSYATK